MAAKETNLPENKDNRVAGSVIPAAPARPPRISVPVGTDVPPPLPSLNLPGPIVDYSPSPTSKYLPSGMEDLIRSTVVTALKDKVTVGGQPGVYENGRIDFPTPQKSEIAGMGVHMSTRAPDLELPKLVVSTPGLDAMAAAKERQESGKGSTWLTENSKLHGLDDREKMQQGKIGGHTALGGENTSMDKAYGHHSAKGGSTDYTLPAELKGDHGRMTGESKEEYALRKQTIKGLAHEKDPEKRAEILNKYAEKRMEQVDIHRATPGSYIPLRVTRADGRTQSLIYVQSAATIKASEGVTRDVDNYFDSYTHPYKVILKKPRDGDTSGGTSLQAGVVYYSRLSLSLQPGDSFDITGLLSYASDTGTDAEVDSGSSSERADTPTPPGMDSAPNHPDAPNITSGGITGWVDISDGDLVYLELTISFSATEGLYVSAANIKVGTDFVEDGDAWADGAYVEDDGDETNPKQTFARIALGKMVGTSIRQYVTTNLIMRQVCIKGKAAIYPTPY